MSQKTLPTFSVDMIRDLFDGFHVEFFAEILEGTVEGTFSGISSLIAGDTSRKSASGPLEKYLNVCLEDHQ